MLKKGKKQGGITLIALVITIIVLLILAAVTINALSGDNGILKRASEAKKGTNQSTVEEITKLSINGLITDNLGDVSTITPQVLANRINKDYNRTDVTAEGSEFPTNMIFGKEGLKVPVDIKLSVGSAEKNVEGIYSADIDESKIAPQDLFNYEPISTGSNNKIASTGDMSSLPLKEAKITGIKPQYCNIKGYNPETKQNDLTDTNYEIKFEGITDTLIIPYQVEINGEMYKVTEVDLSIGSTSFPSIENIIYPNSVKKIDGADFNSDGILKNVVLPTNIEEIPEKIFYNAYNMKSITIPKNVKKIGYGAFELCSALESIDIPNGVTSIEDDTFYRCDKLKSVNIPSSVTSIGYFAFDQCEELTSINIPDSVTQIGGNCFSNCHKLESINIPKEITSIKRQCFMSCTSLTSIEIPEKIKNIEESAFSHCTKLSSVTYKGVTYKSEAELTAALENAGVTVDSLAFSGTALK